MQINILKIQENPIWAKIAIDKNVRVGFWQKLRKNRKKNPEKSQY